MIELAILLRSTTVERSRAREMESEQIVHKKEKKRDFLFLVAPPPLP